MWRQVQRDCEWPTPTFHSMPSAPTRALCTIIATTQARLRLECALAPALRVHDAAWRERRDAAAAALHARAPLTRRRRVANVTLAYVPFFYHHVYDRVTYYPVQSGAERRADADARALHHMMQHLHIVSDAWSSKSAWTIDLWFLRVRYGPGQLARRAPAPPAVHAPEWSDSSDDDDGSEYDDTDDDDDDDDDDEYAVQCALDAAAGGDGAVRRRRRRRHRQYDDTVVMRSALYTRYASMLNSRLSVLLALRSDADGTSDAAAASLACMRVTCACPMCTVPVTSSILHRELRAVVRLGLASDERAAVGSVLTVPVVLYVARRRQRRARSDDASSVPSLWPRVVCVRTQWYVSAFSLLGWVNRGYRAAALQLLATTRQWRRQRNNARALAAAARAFLRIDCAMCDLVRAALDAHSDRLALGERGDDVRALVAERRRYVGARRARAFGIAPHIARAVYAHDVVAQCDAEAHGGDHDDDDWLHVDSGHHSTPSVMGPVSMRNVVLQELDDGPGADCLVPA